MNDIRLAAFCGHETVLRMILDTKKVDLEAQDQKGTTALMWAAEGGYRKVVEILLDEGVNVNAEGGSFGSALFAAIWGHE